MAKPILLIKMNPEVYTQDQMDRIKEVVEKSCWDYHCFGITSIKVIDIEFQVHVLPEIDGKANIRCTTVPVDRIASDIKRGVS